MVKIGNSKNWIPVTLHDPTSKSWQQNRLLRIFKTNLKFWEILAPSNSHQIHADNSLLRSSPRQISRTLPRLSVARRQRQNHSRLDLGSYLVALEDDSSWAPIPRSAREIEICMIAMPSTPSSLLFLFHVPKERSNATTKVFGFVSPPSFLLV